MTTGPLLPPPVGRRRSRRRVAAGAFATLLAAVLFLAHGPLLVAFAELFRLDDPAPSDAIVLLIGGWICRPVRAAELYQQGMAPLVLVNASDPLPYPDLSESALNRKALIRAGVPADRITVLPKVSTSTREEAIQVREYARTHNVRRIIVVTTAFHTSRARWIFRKVLRDLDVDVRTAAADDPRYNEKNWYTNQGLLIYLQEVIKRVVYQVGY